MSKFKIQPVADPSHRLFNPTPSVAELARGYCLAAAAAAAGALPRIPKPRLAELCPGLRSSARGREKVAGGKRSAAPGLQSHAKEPWGERRSFVVRQGFVCEQYENHLRAFSVFRGLPRERGLK
jgi:hypothetical protein